jgi:RNA polymerase sigma-70 factor (ECF subfamily)
VNAPAAPPASIHGSTARAASAAQQAAELAARESYGRLLAWLAWQWRDLAGAEDALGASFEAALRHWPAEGVPSKPDAWLLTAAKRQLLQAHRHQRLADSPEVLAVLEPDSEEQAPATLPDRRLQLMCLCAHPSLPAALHAPLMLQTVLGLDAKRIAPAFLVAPSAMAQRMVRAKARIRELGLRFELPEAEELHERLVAVLEGIYSAYTLGSDPNSEAPESDGELRSEALFLASLTAELQPDDAEALGLAALLRHCEARRPARLSSRGEFLPLTRQDTRLWSRPLIAEAERLLWRAAALRRPGPFQIEAAIQSAHNQRAFTGQTPWAQIAQLYGVLTAQVGSIGARIGHAVALAETGDTAEALRLLEALPEAGLPSHQPYWVALAHVQRLRGADAEAEAALLRAAGLTADPQVRRFLLQGHSAQE